MASQTKPEISANVPWGGRLLMAFPHLFRVFMSFFSCLLYNVYVLDLQAVIAAVRGWIWMSVRLNRSSRGNTRCTGRLRSCDCLAVSDLRYAHSGGRHQVDDLA